jgi:hypothetical protein
MDVLLVLSVCGAILCQGFRTNAHRILDLSPPDLYRKINDSGPGAVILLQPPGFVV